jgi:hypothetical protein
VISDNPADLLGYGAPYALDWAAGRYRSVWIVMRYGLFHTFALRPAERYLVDRYFPVAAIETDAAARAVRFAAVRAPEGPPSLLCDCVFGDQLALAGFDLPQGDDYNAGEVVPVSLVWRPLNSMSVDYNVSVQVADRNGFPVAQHDGPPQGTFGYTSRWEVGAQYRDNHGIQLPNELPPGMYTLQVIVYNWRDGRRLPVTSSDGATRGDLAVLMTITVEAR